MTFYGEERVFGNVEDLEEYSDPDSSDNEKKESGIFDHALLFACMSDSNQRCIPLVKQHRARTSPAGLCEYFSNRWSWRKGRRESVQQSSPQRHATISCSYELRYEDSRRRLAAVGQEDTVSNSELRPPSTDGSPEAKRARMVHNWTSSSAPTVAKRLEDTRATLEERDPNSSYTIESTVPEFQKKKELDEDERYSLRMIAQHLRNLGLSESLASLISETGVSIEHNYAERLRDSIIDEDWDSAIDVLRRAELTYPPDRIPPSLDKAREEIVIYKILSYFDDNDLVSAFEVLRTEMQRYPSNQELQELSKLLFYSPEDIHGHHVLEQYRYYCEQRRLLRTMERILPDDFMLPENQLKKTFRNGKKQYNHIGGFTMEENVASRPDRLHNGGDSRAMRLHKAEFLLYHSTEVFALSFSPDGRYLATASTADNIVIFKVDPKTAKLTAYKAFGRPDATIERPVKHISWRHDSRLFCVVGDNKGSGGQFHPFMIDLPTGQRWDLRILNASAFTRGPPNQNIVPAYTACTFVGHTKDIAFADENGHFEVHSTGNMWVYKRLARMPPLAYWPGFRIKQMASTSYGGIVALDSQNRIRMYQYLNGTSDETLVHEHHLIVSFCIHKSERLIAVQTEYNLHLWDIAYKCLVRTFANAAPYYFIDTAFGGPMHRYIAASSPGGLLKIFDLNDSYPRFETEAHASNVTALAWHPKIPYLIVSSGPDRKLIAWHLQCPKGMCKENVREEKSLADVKKQIRREQRDVRRKRLSYEARVAEASDDADQDLETQHLVNGLTNIHLANSPRKKKRVKSSKLPLLDITDGAQDDSTQSHDSEFKSSDSSSREGTALTNASRQLSLDGISVASSS